MLPCHSVAYNTNLLFDRFGLAARSYSEFYRGYIGEVIVYDRTLTDQEVTDLISFLKTKWGI